MNSKLTGVILFTLGAAVGSVVTWKVVEHKYEEKIAREVEAARKSAETHCVGNCGCHDTEPSDEDEVVSEPSPVLEEIKAELKRQKDLKRSEDISTKSGYTNYTEYSKSDDDEDDEEEGPDPDEPEDDESSVYFVREGAAEEPYTISPDDFGEEDGYETETLTYYADGILADDQDNLIESVDKMVGIESLDKFGEYEDDVVYVRNEQYKCDYEILLDLRRWEDVVAPPKVKTRPEVPRKPHQMED